MICSSCGFEIKGTRHGPYDGRFVCDTCWNNPALFFPDKLNSTLEKIAQDKVSRDFDDQNMLKVIDIYRSYPKIDSQNLEETWKKITDVNLMIRVIRIKQKGMPLYIGKVQAKELLLLATSDRWKDEALDGYQREKFKEKTREIKQYLEGCSISIIPALLVSFNTTRFIPSFEDFGTLELPLKPGIISILDGQQRTGGFEDIYKEIKKLQTMHSLANRDELIKKAHKTARVRNPHRFCRFKRDIEKIEKGIQ